MVLECKQVQKDFKMRDSKSHKSIKVKTHGMYLCRRCKVNSMRNVMSLHDQLIKSKRSLQRHLKQVYRLVQKNLTN